MTVQLTDIYAALRDSVRFYPAQETPCKRLQTWRVFQQSLGVEAYTQNLGANICDKGKPYFWSRDWTEKKYNPNGITWKFPLLFAFETEGAMVDPFGGSPRMVYTIQVGVLDVLTDTKDARNCTGCNARTVNEIYADTEALLLGALSFLENTVSAKIDGVPVWANAEMLKQGSESGALTVTEKSTVSILHTSQRLNQEAPFFRVERSAEKMYGTAMNLRIETQVCPSVEWNFTETDFGVLAQEAGCKTC